MEYFIAGSVKEAVDKLSDAGGEGMVIAGGTDLMIDLAEGKKKARTLVDVTRIPEMRVIEKQEYREQTLPVIVRRAFEDIARQLGIAI